MKSYKYATFFQCSRELADDTTVDLLGYFARQATEALGLVYGVDLVTGNGSSKPTGLATSVTAGRTSPTGGATTLGTQATAGLGVDNLVLTHAALAEPYANSDSRAWLMRNATLGIVRTTKTATDGIYAIPPDATGFMGAPFVVDPNVAAMAANALSIYYGDWSRYFLRIAGGVRFERSDDFAFQKDLVSFRCAVRLDGALVDSNAVKFFKNSAT